jgi:hypothetical protein
MRREIIGILSVLVLVGGCGGGGDDLMPRITALATSQLTLRPNAAGALHWHRRAESYQRRTLGESR